MPSADALEDDFLLDVLPSEDNELVVESEEKTLEKRPLSEEESEKPPKKKKVSSSYLLPLVKFLIPYILHSLKNLLKILKHS